MDVSTELILDNLVLLFFLVLFVFFMFFLWFPAWAHFLWFLRVSLFQSILMFDLLLDVLEHSVDDLLWRCIISLVEDYVLTSLFLFFLTHFIYLHVELIQLNCFLFCLAFDWVGKGFHAWFFLTLVQYLLKLVMFWLHFLNWLKSVFILAVPFELFLFTDPLLKSRCLIWVLYLELDVWLIVITPIARY